MTSRVTLILRRIRSSLWVLSCGICLGILHWQIKNTPALALFWDQNKIEPGKFGEYLTLIALWTAACVTVSTLYFLYHVRLLKKDIDREFESLRSLYQIPAFLVFLPFLFQKEFWQGHPFISMFVTGLWALFLFRYLSGLGRKPWKILNELSLWRIDRLFEMLLASAIFVYTVYFSRMAIGNHRKFGTSFDLGNFQNMLLNTLHGTFLGCSACVPESQPAIQMVNHLPLANLLWLPVYAFARRAETLLTLQSLTLAVAAVPLYFLAKNALRSKKAAFFVSLLYLACPVAQVANLFDVHELCFLPLGVFLFFLFLRKKLYLPYLVALVFCLAIKEDISLCFLFVALHIWLTTHHRRFALTTALGAFFWFFAAQIFMAYGTHDLSSVEFSGYYDCLIPRGSFAPWAILKLMIVNYVFILKHVLTADKILFFLQMTMPLALLPLFLPSNWLLLIYGLGITLLGCRPPLYEIGFHYAWYVLPFLYIGLIASLRRMKLKERWFRIHQKEFARGPGATERSFVFYRSALLTAGALTLIMNFQYGALFGPKGLKTGAGPVYSGWSDHDARKLRLLGEILEGVPRENSLAAHEKILPHLNEFLIIKAYGFYFGEADRVLLFQNTGKKPSDTEKDLYKNYKLIRENDFFRLFLHKRLIPDNK